jgi:hypothetical protein
MTIIWTCFVATGAGAAFVLFTAGLRRWPIIGAIGLSAVVLIAWEVPQPPPLAVVAGNSVYAFDILSLGFLIVGLMDISRIKRNLGRSFPIFPVIAALLLLGFVRGIGVNGLGTTTNDLRGFLMPFSALFWALSLEWTPHRVERAMSRLSFFIGWLLVAVAGYHLSRYGLGNSADFVDPSTGVEQTSRILVSGQAFVLLLCTTVLVWTRDAARRRLHIATAAVFLVVILLAQQRSVWLALLVSLVVVLFASSMRMKLVLVSLGILLIAVFTFLTAAGGGLLGSLVGTLEGSASSSGTYDGRVSSWSNLLTASFTKGPFDALFGQPLGTSYGRFQDNGQWVVFAPHNWYLSLYLRIGFIGLSAFLFLLGALVHGAVRRPINMSAVAVTVALIVYGWTYSWPWYAVPFLALAYMQTPRIPTSYPSGPARSPSSANTRLVASGIHSDHASAIERHS